MSLSNNLAAALDKTLINEAFNIARTTRGGILGTIGFGAAAAPYEGYKYGWLDAYKGGETVTVNGTIASGVTALVLDSSAGIKVGAVLSFLDEVMNVTAVDANGTDVTIARGAGGSTAVALPDGSVLEIDSRGVVENSTGSDDGLYQPENEFNFFQTLDTQITLSRRALATMQFGSTNDLQFQLAERLRVLTNQMDKMLIRGRRMTIGSGDSLVSYAGGMKFFSDVSGAIKVDGGGAAVTQTLINNLNETVIQAGGTTDSLAVSVKKARQIHENISAN